MLAVDDVLVDSMRGRSSTWTRIRVNLRHVAEDLRPPQGTPDPDDDPDTRMAGAACGVTKEGFSVRSQKSPSVPAGERLPVAHMCNPSGSCPFAICGNATCAGNARPACVRRSPRRPVPDAEAPTINPCPGSSDFVLPAFVPGTAAASECSAQFRQGWFVSAFSRYGVRNPASSSRRCCVKLAQTPTCCSMPELSNNPRSNEPTDPSPFLCQRKPATTQSQSRSCLTFSITRLSDSYASAVGFAITPSRPAPSNRENQSAATFRSRVAGVKWSGGSASASIDSSRLRRCSKGSARTSWLPSHSRSKKTTDAGIC